MFRCLSQRLHLCGPKASQCIPVIIPATTSSTSACRGVRQPLSVISGGPALPLPSPSILCTSSSLVVSSSPCSGNRTASPLNYTQRRYKATSKGPSPALAAAAKEVMFKQLSNSDFSKGDSIYEAYLEYFNHIRFRNKWAEPQLARVEVEPLFREASSYIVRIRQFLDEQTPGEKLRVKDGAAQTWLHTPEAPAALKEGDGAFISGLVHATMQDATGYVEGLSKDIVNDLLDRLEQHRYNPHVHFQHLLSELTEVYKLIAPLEKPAGVRFYVEEGSKQDKVWRAAMGHAYDLVSALKEASLLKEEDRLAPAAAEGGDEKAAASSKKKKKEEKGNDE